MYLRRKCEPGEPGKILGDDETKSKRKMGALWGISVGPALFWHTEVAV